MSSLPPPQELLPHRGSAVLLRRVVAADARSLRAVARLSRDHPFAAGAWCGAALLEAAAQAAAAHGALAAAGAAGAAPRPGWMVGIKCARLPAAVPTDVDLEVEVQRVGGAGPLAIYAARVFVAGSESMSAELSVWIPRGGSAA